MKKLGVILLDIILAFFLLSIVIYKVSELDTVNGGSLIPRIGSISFVPVRDKIATVGINNGDFLVATRSGMDKLKSGDIVIYKDGENNIAITRVSAIKGDAFTIESGNGNTGVGAVIPIVSIEGICSIKLPYFGYIAAFADTEIGTIISIAVPIIVVLVVIAAIIVDIIHNTSRHRKRIMRKRQRRKERYIKEGMYGNKRAMV